MPTVRRMQHNPGNPDQKLLYWSDGHIEARGGAPDPGHDHNWITGSSKDVGVDLDVIDWTLPSGYDQDAYGGVHVWGDPPPTVPAPAPTYTNGSKRWVKVSMNPNGSGQGQALDALGRLYAFGGAPQAPGGTDILTPNGEWWAVDFSYHWGTHEYVVLMKTGKVIPRNGAPAIIGSYLQLPLLVFRSIQMLSWTPLQCWTQDVYGGTVPVGDGTPPIHMGAQHFDVPTVADFVKVADAPLEFSMVTFSGVVINWIVSDPPVFEWTGPPSPVTDTTRPLFSFSLTDPDNNEIDHIHARLYRQDVYEAANFNWSNDFSEYQSPYEKDFLSFNGDLSEVQFSSDIFNGNYYIVGYATDITGKTSERDAMPIKISVAPKAAPVLSIISSGDTPAALLSVPADLDTTFSAHFQFGEDGETWTDVYGGTTVPTGEALRDEWVPLNRYQWYRARVWREEPYISSEWCEPVRYGYLGATEDQLSDAEEVGSSIPLKLKRGFSVSHEMQTFIGNVEGDSEARVVHGVERSAVTTLEAWLVDPGEHDAVTALLKRPGRVLLLRTTLGRSWFLARHGIRSQTHMTTVPEPYSLTPVGDTWELSADVIEVSRP